MHYIRRTKGGSVVEERTLEALLKRFDTEYECAAILFGFKWPNGFCCTRCNGREVYRISTRRLPLFECLSCKHQHSLTVGTIMEGSRTSLRKWFAAICLFSCIEQGISALGLSKAIEVTYKTAWLMLHKLRSALNQPACTRLLQGIVRIQGGAYGSPFNPYTESDPKRYPMLAGGTINASGEVAMLRLHVVERRDIHNGYIAGSGEQSFIQQFVSADAEEVKSIRLRMDRSRFRPLVQCMNDFGRWAHQVFHGLGRPYLQAYADEYSFRINARMSGISLLDQVLHICANMSLVPNLQSIARQYSSQRHGIAIAP